MKNSITYLNLKVSKLITVFLVVIFMFFNFKVLGQAASATWSLNTTSTNTPTVSGAVTAQNLTNDCSFTTFTWGGTTDQNLWVKNWPSASTIDFTKYLEFKMSPTSGNLFNFNSLSFQHLNGASTGGTWYGVVYYSLDNWATSNIIGSQFNVTTTSTTFSNSNLSVRVNDGTTLKVRLYFYNTSGSDKILFKNVIISGTTCSPSNYLSDALNGNSPYVVGTGGKWSTITAALADLKTCMVGSVTLELDDTYRTSQEANETYPLDFSGLPTSSSKTLTIRPKSNVTAVIPINATSVQAKSKIFDFNGTDYVTIDGRIGSTGSTSLISIENQNTAAGSAISFSNDATNNIIRYCTLMSNFGSSSEGIVNFSTTTGTTGNDDNTITYCVFDGTASNTVSPAAAGTAQNGIYSLGTLANTNSGNTISYCEFKDIFVNGSGTYSSMIFLDGNNDTWTISNNSFYQSNPRASTGSNIAHMSVVDIDDGDGYTISNNYFGGSAASCSGTWTQQQLYASSSSNTGRTEFYGINLAANVGTTTATSIQGNKFAGFSWTTYQSSGIWNAILVASGTSKLNIGTTTKNIIGDTTSTTSLVFDNTASSTYSINLFDIASTTTVNISNNVFAGISTSNTSGEGYSIRAIKTSGTSGVYTISSNKIGHATGTIVLGGSSTAAGVCTFYGINNAATGVTTIGGDVSSNGNTIKNITVYGTGASILYPIYNTGGATNSEIKYNTITNLTNASSGSSGINTMIFNSAAPTIDISYNTINTITCTNGSFIGVHDNVAASVDHTITYNTIGNSSSNISMDGSGNVTGLEIGNTGTYTCSNNTIQKITSSVNGTIYGLSFSDASTVTANSNTVTNITTNVAASNTIIGIYCGSTGTYNLSGNNLTDFTNASSGSGAPTICGIKFNGINTSSTVQKNKMTGYAANLTSTPNLYGIWNNSTGTVLLYNNLFICSNGSYTNNVNIYGVLDGTNGSTLSGTAANVTLYYNTFSITGSNSGAISAGQPSSVCYYHSNATVSKLQAAKNNIFNNQRTISSGTTSHYSFYIGGATVAVSGGIDYNYYSAPLDANFGYPGAAKTASSGANTFNASTQGYGGTNSKYYSPNSGAQTGNSNAITINSDGSLDAAHVTTVGTGADLDAITGCDEDINNTTRSTSGGVKGCYESISNYYSKTSVSNTDANTLANWTSSRNGTGVVPTNFTTAASFYIQSGHQYQVTGSWTGNASSTIYVESGGALDINAKTLSTWSVLNVAGTGVSSSGALLNSSTSAATLSLPITLSANATVTSSGAGNLTLTGNITTASYTLTVNGNNNTTISTGVISGTGSVSKSGSGILTLSGTNTHSGGTTVSAGTLAIGNNSGLGTGTLTISGGSLDASGADRTITNAITVSNDFGFTGSYNLTQNTGAISLSSSSVITVIANNLTLNGNISSPQTTTTITTTGTGTWTCPANISTAKVECFGGGGQGAGVNGNGGGGFGGGGGGAYASSIISVTPSTIYNYSVAAPTTGGACSAVSGASTWFNANSTSPYSSSAIVPTSTSNGVLAVGGSGGNCSSGGAGGATANCIGTTKYSGGTGANRNWTSGNGTGGGGGGAGSSSSGSNGAAPAGGAGGTGTNGLGIGGNGANGYSFTSSPSTTNGSNGGVPGGGGSGAYWTGSNPSSGQGASGQIIISYTVSYSITKSGIGTLTLGGTNSFVGGVTLSAGTLNINNASALGATSGTFTISGGTLDNTSGSSITMVNYPMSWAGHFTFTGTNALNMGTGAVSMSASRQLTVSASTLTIGGVISGSTFGLTKLGAGTLTLSGVNLYTGTTTITAGTLTMGASNAIPVGGAGVVMNGGTLNTGNFSAGSTTTNIGTLTLTDNSTLALGIGTLYFSGSTATTWTAAKTLTVKGFVSTAASTAGTGGRLFVNYSSGNTCSNCGLTGSSGTNQLGLISFNTATIGGVAGVYGATQLISGEIVAISSSTIITSGTITAFTACSGSNSAEKTFTVSGTNLSANLVVTPPPGFEVSETSGGVFSSSISFTPSSGAVSNKTVYVRTTLSATGTLSGNIICSSSPAISQNVSVSGTITTLPTANIAYSSSSFCKSVTAGQAVTLTGTTGGIYSVSPSGLTIDASSGSITPSTSTAGVYTVTYTIAASGGCSVVTATASVTINSLPTVSLGSSRVCVGSTVALSPSTLGTWVSNNTLSATVVSGTGIVTGVSLGSPTFTYTQTSTGCSSTTSILTVNALPTVSMASNSVCVGATVQLSPTIFSVIGLWSSNNANVATVNAVTALVTGVSSSNTAFTFTQTSTGCVASTTELTVYAIPTVTTTAGSRCGAGTVAIGASASSGTINWYSVSTGGLTLGTGTSYTTGSISSSTTYYVDATANGCTTGSRSSVLATVNAIPTITSTTAGSSCGSGTVALGAAATAGTINWYSVLTGGSTLGTGTSYTTGSISSSTTYYVEATANGCTTGSRSSVLATVNPIPTVSMASSSVCVGNTVALSPSTLGTWTSSNTLSATVGATTGVVTGVASGSPTFTYTQTSTGCTATTTSLQVNSPQVSVNTNITQGHLVWIGAVSGDWTNPSNWLSYGSTGVYSILLIAPATTSSIIVPISGTCVVNYPSISSSIVYAKDVVIETGAVLSMGSGGVLNIAGNLTNNGTFTASSGSVIFNGAVAQTISGNAPTFNNLTINNTSGGVTLGVSTTVLGTLTLSLGKLNTQGFTLTIGSSTTDGTISGGSLSSYIVAYDAGTTVGYVKHFVNANNVLHSYPIGDLTNYSPLTFTLTANSGLSGAYFTVYTKNVKVPGLNVSFSSYLKRYWDGVSNGMTSPLTYTISYVYTDSDIAGSETNLQPIKKSGSTWYKPVGAVFTNGQTQGSSTINTLANTLTWSGLTSFSTYGGAGDQMVSLPIETVMFKGEKTAQGNKLAWRTDSEHQNDYFTIEKTIDGQVFEIVGKVDGSGNTNKVIEYTLIDDNFINGINYYRLVKTNFDGYSVKTDLISIDNRKEDSAKIVAYETNILGQEINEFYRGLVIVVYTDGTSLKVIR